MTNEVFIPLIIRRVGSRRLLGSNPSLVPLARAQSATIDADRKSRGLRVRNKGIRHVGECVRDAPKRITPRRQTQDQTREAIGPSNIDSVGGSDSPAWPWTPGVRENVWLHTSCFNSSAHWYMCRVQSKHGWRLVTRFRGPRPASEANAIATN